MVDPEIEGYLCGQAAGLVHEITPAAQIVWDMVEQAAVLLERLSSNVSVGEA